VRGSAQPRPCQPLSYCPAGTQIGRFYGGALFCFIIDVLLVVYFFLRRYRWEPLQNKLNLTERPRALLERQQPGSSAALSAKEAPLPSPENLSPAPSPQAATAVADWDSARAASPRAGSVLRGAWALARRASFTLSSLSSPSASPKADPVDAAVLASAKSLLNTSFRRCNGDLSIRIEFTKLSLTLPPPVSKTILSSVTGVISPARVTAIMGPSGAGKTTFLSVLLGTGLKRTAGTVKINGAPADLSSLGRLTGFVPQEDVMLRELTVRENIAHSARIRLPRVGWTSAEIDSHVDAVIEVLGLRHCADTPTDRISGGQRKRVNIGMELALAPAAIFLDEPTSGLDSTAALQVCSTLKNIADLGVTVVAVIHQPRLDIFKSFDDLLLLAPGGKTVYMGPQKGVIGYFQGLGLQFSDAGNPADDLLDFVAGDQQVGVTRAVASASKAFALFGGAAAAGKAETENPLAAAAAAEAAAAAAAAAAGSSLATPGSSTGSLDKIGGSSNSLKDLEAALGEGDAEGALAYLKGKDVANYLSWKWFTGKEESPPSPAGSSAAEALGAPRPPQDLQATLALRGASFVQQFLLCHNRSLLQQYRQPSWLALELGVCVFAGGMMGIAATSVDELFSGILNEPFTPLSPAPNVQLLPSLGFFVSMAVGIAGSPAAVRAFGEERDVYLREVSAHHSGSAYFLAKNVASLYRLTLASLHFAGFFYLVALPTASFDAVMIMVWGMFFGVYGLSFIMSMLVTRANGALLGTIASLIVACLCGYGPSLNQGREWALNLGEGQFLGLITLQDMSYSRWANEIWVHAETLPYRDLFFVDAIPASVRCFFPPLFCHVALSYPCTLFLQKSLLLPPHFNLTLSRRLLVIQ
jgi:ABC-type multidrug transport system ATPase subunit